MNKKAKAHALRCASEDAAQEAVFWQLAGDADLAERRRIDRETLEWRARMAEGGDPKQRRLFEADT